MGLGNNINSCPPPELLSGYVDAMLDGKELRVVELHLQVCESCQHEVDELTITRDFMKSVRDDVPALTSFQWDSALRQARLAKYEGSVDRTLSLSRLTRVLASAGAVGVLCVTLLIGGPKPAHTPVVTGPAAEAAIETLDVSALVSAHADYLAGARLIDSSSNRILRSDLASDSSGDQDMAVTDL